MKKRGRDSNKSLPLSFSPSRRLSVSLLGGGGIAARNRRQDWFQDRFLVRGLAGLGFGSRGRAIIVKRQSGDDAANLNRIEGFAPEQFMGQAIQSVAVLNDDLPRP